MLRTHKFLMTQIILVCSLLFLSACDKAKEKPASKEKSSSATHTTEQYIFLPNNLKSGILEYKSLLNQKKYTEGVTKIRTLIPQLEKFVEENPNNAEGNLELSGAYIMYMYVITNYLPLRDWFPVVAQCMEDQYPAKAKKCLDKFLTLIGPNDPRRSGIDSLRSWMADIDSKIKR